MRFHKLILICVTLVVTMVFSTGIANADSIGQCNLRPGNEMHSTKQWLQTLNAEGVLGETQSTIFGEAGFFSLDQTVQKWVSQRVVMVSAARSFSAPDKGCSDGKLFPAGARHYPIGKRIFAVLPGNYNKNDNFSLHKTKTFSQAHGVWMKGIGLVECSNPVPASVYVIIYVKPTPHPKKPVVPQPTQTPHLTPPPSVIECSNVNNKDTEIIGGNCGRCQGIDVCNHEEKHETPPPTCELPSKGTYPHCYTVTVKLNKIEELELGESADACAITTGEDITAKSVAFEFEGTSAVIGNTFENGEHKFCVAILATTEMPPGDIEKIKVTAWIEGQPDINADDSEPFVLKYPIEYPF